MGWFKAVANVVTKATKVFGFLNNPIVALVTTLAIAWIFRPKTPEINDFGTSSYDDFERGILLNKQSNDASISVISFISPSDNTKAIYK